jgi:hypothetical protein
MKKATHKSDKDTLSSALTELKAHYVAPVTFEHCRTKQGAKLPFDALVVVQGRAGVICFDAPSHFAAEDEEELAKQHERDQARNRYARDAKISLLRVPTKQAGHDTSMYYLASFVEALQRETTSFVMLSHPELYPNFYGDGTLPLLVIATRPTVVTSPTFATAIAAAVATSAASVQTIPCPNAAALVTQDGKVSGAKDAKDTKDTKDTKVAPTPASSWGVSLWPFGSSATSTPAAKPAAVPAAAPAATPAVAPKTAPTAPAAVTPVAPAATAAALPAAAPTTVAAKK